MNDDHDEQERPVRPASDGVRIIGAEEAAAALESGQAHGRRPDDAPRYGDVPPAPKGPRPPIRFPLGDAEPPDVVRPAAVPPPGSTWPDVDPDAPREVAADEAPLARPATSLPHWSEPATGEVPQILADEPESAEVAPGDEAWSTFTGQGPRWRDQPADWEEADFEDASMLSDDRARLGALNPDRSDPNDVFSFEVPDAGEADLDDDAVAPAPARRRSRPQLRRQSPPEPSGGSGGGGRDIGTAIGTGVALALVLLMAFRLGPAYAGLLITAVVVLAAAELFGALQRAGFAPATLLGLVATACTCGAAYWKGEVAYPLVLALFVVFSLLWYLSGVVRAQPTLNVGASLLGFVYVGVLGSFALLILGAPPGPGHEGTVGTGVLIGAILGTVAYDVAGLFIGTRLGRTPLAAEISPNKTREGLVGGCLAAVTVCFLVLGVFGVDPWGAADALKLGLVVAVAAPLGDLCESMIKRDLGIKDMGSILPGHGGVLDRIDAMLFVVPATYYLAKLLDLVA